MPTYNEKENIYMMLKRLINVFAFINDFDMHVLVVDDNSPDGTSAIVEEYTRKYPNVHLIKGKKEGSMPTVTK